MVRSASEASGLGREVGMVERQGVRGEEFVGATLTTSEMSWGTLRGWTLWTIAKAGRRRTVVGSE